MANALRWLSGSLNGVKLSEVFAACNCCRRGRLWNPSVESAINNASDGRKPRNYARCKVKKELRLILILLIPSIGCLC